MTVVLSPLLSEWPESILTTAPLRLTVVVTLSAWKFESVVSQATLTWSSGA